MVPSEVANRERRNLLGICFVSILLSALGVKAEELNLVVVKAEVTSTHLYWVLLSLVSYFLIAFIRFTVRDYAFGVLDTAKDLLETSEQKFDRLVTKTERSVTGKERVEANELAGQIRVVRGRVSKMEPRVLKLEVYLNVIFDVWFPVGLALAAYSFIIFRLKHLGG